MAERSRSLLAVALVVLSVLAPVATAATAGAASRAPGSGAVEESVSDYGPDVEVVASGDATYVLGPWGDADATPLEMVDADGSTVWSRTVPDGVDGALAVHPDGGVVAVTPGYRSKGVSVVHVGDDGTERWRTDVYGDQYWGAVDDVDVAVNDAGESLLVLDRENENVFVGLSTDGEPIWNRTVGDEADEPDRSLSGLSAVGKDFVAYGRNTAFDSWMLRTSASGTVEFDRQYGVSWIAGVAGTDDGGLLVGGVEFELFGADESHPVAMRVGTKGTPKWTRGIGAPGTHEIDDVVASEDGIVLVGERGVDRSVGHVLGVDPVGPWIGTVSASGDEIGYRRFDAPAPDFATRGTDSEVVLGRFDVDDEVNVSRSRAAVPATVPVDTTPDTYVTSGSEHETRGTLAVHGDPGDTYELVSISRKPETETRVARTVTVGADGTGTVEASTLSFNGAYAFRDEAGTWLRVSKGTVVERTDDRSAAAFELGFTTTVSSTAVDQSVETYDGERNVTLRFDADGPVMLSAVQYDHGRVDAEDLANALEPDPDFQGTVERYGQRFAVVEPGPDDAVDVHAADLEAGLFRFYATTERGATLGFWSAENVAVVHERRPVSVQFQNDTVSVPADDGSRAKVNVSGLDGGIGAFSMVANTSDELSIAARTPLQGGCISRDCGPWQEESRWTVGTARADATGDQVHVATVLFGSDGGESVNETTVQARLDWIVDRDGTPYSVPDPATVNVTEEDPDAGSGPVDRADEDDDGEISTGELQAAIRGWTRGEFTTSELQEVVRAWATGT